MNIFNHYLILLATYIFTCCWVIKRYYGKTLGAFQAPFIFSLASMMMMIPQFCVIIYNPYYNPDLLYDLTYCMCTSTLAFSFGFEKSTKKSVHICRDLDLKKSRYVFFFMFLVGLYCAIQSYGQVLNHFASGESDIRDNHTYQVLLFFMLYFDIGVFYALTYIIKERKVPKFIYLMLTIGGLYYMYIILVLARRIIVVKLLLSLGLLTSIVRPKWQNKIKSFVVIIFTLGCVYQASISNIRANLHAGESATAETNVWENYKKSFYAPDLTHGMDLGNAALFIRHCKDEYNYNFGLFLWDDIVTWYMPKFIFGEAGKKAMKVVSEDERKYIDSICHGVSTQTGYYQSFAAFSYFGFILFYILGMVIGFIWRRIEYSSLYLLIYLCLMYHMPSLASHGFSYVIGQVETFLIFCYPLIYTFTLKKKVNTSKVINHSK